MREKFCAVSLSYENAPIAIREVFSLNEQEIKMTLRFLKEFSGIEEALVVSTCNRTEVFFTSENRSEEDIIKVLCVQKGISYNENIRSYFQVIANAKEAVKHLFYMSVGLFSQVVGDIQIINQVKTAYQCAADESMAGPFIHRLLHTIFFANKKIVQETAFRDGAASVSYVASELVKQFLPNFVQPKILVVGLGEIGLDVCKNLSEIKDASVTVMNRTQQKAEEIAESCGFMTLPYAQKDEAIANHDIIISSVRTHKPIITKASLTQKVDDLLHYKYFIDLSVPRSIEPDLEMLGGAILYNIDDLQSKANSALAKRKDSIPQVKAILDNSIVDFSEWSDEFELSPTINKLNKALENIRQEEIKKYLKDATEKESEIIEEVTKNLIKKVVKLPVLQLKAACKRGEAETLVDILNDLFDLESQDAEVKYQ